MASILLDVADITGLLPHGETVHPFLLFNMGDSTSAAFISDTFKPIILCSLKKKYIFIVEEGRSWHNQGNEGTSGCSFWNRSLSSTSQSIPFVHGFEFIVMLTVKISMTA